jgi:hypothetical protein
MKPSQEAVSERPLWADLIRVVGLFGLVLLHAVAVPATQLGDIPEGWRWAANL